MDMPEELRVGAAAAAAAAETPSYDAGGAPAQCPVPVSSRATARCAASAAAVTSAAWCSAHPPSMIAAMSASTIGSASASSSSAEPRSPAARVPVARDLLRRHMAVSTATACSRSLQRFGSARPTAPRAWPPRPRSRCPRSPRIPTSPGLVRPEGEAVPKRRGARTGGAWSSTWSNLPSWHRRRLDELRGHQDQQVALSTLERARPEERADDRKIGEQRDFLRLRDVLALQEAAEHERFTRTHCHHRLGAPHAQGRDLEAADFDRVGEIERADFRRDLQKQAPVVLILRPNRQDHAEVLVLDGHGAVRAGDGHRYLAAEKERRGSPRQNDEAGTGEQPRLAPLRECLDLRDQQVETVGREPRRGDDLKVVDAAVERRWRSRCLLAAAPRDPQRLLRVPVQLHDLDLQAELDRPPDRQQIHDGGDERARHILRFGPVNLCLNG